MSGPQFSSLEEELNYWKGQASEYKERYEEVKEELEEFQINSHELEAELEASLEQTEQKNRELLSAKCRLDMEVDSLREKLEKLQLSSHKQITQLEDELAQVTGQRDELVKYIRELEQSNDDLERTKRSTLVSLEDFESRLNQAIERNAFLESELDEKESLVITVQRLKDESRDLHSELAVKEKVPSPVKPRPAGLELEKQEISQSSEVVDSNKLVAEDVNMVPQTPEKPSYIPQIVQGSQTPLTPSARISALNIVGDLLRKVGALENKLASCRNYVNNQPPRASKSGSHSPLSSPRAKRLHRGGGSVQSDVSTGRSSTSAQSGYVNVQVTV